MDSGLRCPYRLISVLVTFGKVFEKVLLALVRQR